MGSDIARQLGIDDILQKLSKYFRWKTSECYNLESPVEIKGKGIRIKGKCGG